MTLAEQYMAYAAEMEKQAQAPVAHLLTDERGVAGKAKDWASRMGDKARAEGAKQKFVAEGIVGRGAGAPMAQYARRAAGQGAVAGAAATLGGVALHKLLAKKKTVGQKLVGALKKNRAAIGAGAAGAAGLAGLAAYRKNQK